MLAASFLESQIVSTYLNCSLVHSLFMCFPTNMYWVSTTLYLEKAMNTNALFYLLFFFFWVKTDFSWRYWRWVGEMRESVGGVQDSLTDERAPLQNPSWKNEGTHLKNGVASDIWSGTICPGSTCVNSFESYLLH